MDNNLGILENLKVDFISMFLMSATFMCMFLGAWFATVMFFFVSLDAGYARYMIWFKGVVFFAIGTALGWCSIEYSCLFNENRTRNSSDHSAIDLAAMFLGALAGSSFFLNLVDVKSDCL